ncbi:hypothetical protein MYK68_04070 [Gordonia sp. PP30]|uniref:hypothetical protein n=1 Tax=Gordonia sp. PP30 TaxID=2935861 RepID=UPI001FFF1342|nr:hypothetical protein [Gordonia sp. PP30]UQE75796.1 hypothetical protein MYK68_04070 [Gordonia sp. PP30]
MISPNHETDLLVWSVRRVLGAGEWLLQEISDHGHADECCDGPADALAGALVDLPRQLAAFTHYSDGRPIVSYVKADGGGMQFYTLWPPHPADMPTEAWEELPTAVAPHARHGDRGYVVVRWCPVTFTGSVRYIAPPRLEVVR